MSANWEFRLRTPIRFGGGMLSKLSQTVAPWGRRIFWVGYRTPVGLETVYEKVRQQLSIAGLAVQEFLEVDAEPDVPLVNRGAEAARAFGAEVVLGVGGGSVLDTAKAIAALARMGGPLADYLPLPTPARRIDQALPILAVPTTAGTGSEVTSLAVFHWQDPAQPDIRMKLTLAAEVLVPKVALVDPELMASCPVELTARCAADALAHAMEASMSRRASPLVHLLAEEAIGQILGYLPAALARPEDRQAREALALSATMAGMALQQAGATLGHAMAHALGALAGVPHGLAVAQVTPAALRYNMTECSDLLARWSRRLALPGRNPLELAEAFLAQTEQLFQKANLLERIVLPGPAEVDWPGRLAQNAFQSTPIPLKLNPRKIDEPTLAELFREILKEQCNTLV